jgi:nucleoside-diphosphate-sugar epimerase
VLHLAARLRKCPSAEIYRINLESTRALVRCASSLGVRHFIYASTENALREDIGDAYADSKRRAEEAVRAFGSFLILRPCMIYGDGETHGLGRLVNLVLKNRVVPLFGGLKAKTQPIFIDDVFEYFVRAVERGICGEYLLAGRQMITLNAFMKKVCEIKKIRRFFIPIPRSFFYSLALAGDLFMPSLGWGKNQFNNIYSSRTYSIDETVKAFSYEPRSLESAFGQWLMPDGLHHEN